MACLPLPGPCPVTLTNDADGNLTSFSMNGHVLVDVCAALS
jgi:hypothetical protein